MDDQRASWVGNLRVAVILFLSALTVIAFLPLQLFGLALAKFGYTSMAGWVPVYFHRTLLFLFGIRWKVVGKLSKERPLLIAANHVSWLDIVILGAIAPLSFVAKADMKSWPIFGQLAQLQRTVFVKREERRNVKHQASEIADRMTAREIMVLFPEGTTGDGHLLLPLKTPLFEAAKLALHDTPVVEAVVQPVALNYTRLHGLPIGRARKAHISWPGEIGLAESLIPILRTGALDVSIEVTEPLTLTEDSNRKLIAAQAASQIRERLRTV